MQKKLHHTSFYAMHTRMEILMYGCDNVIFNEVAEQIMTKTQMLEKLMSRFDPKAELYNVNLEAHKNWVPLSKTLFNILDQCIRFNQLTLGYFDVCYTIKKTITGIDIPRVLLDQKTLAVKFEHPDTTIDLGGVGKGIALDHIKNILKNYRIENALISFGESSLLTLGKHPHGAYWPLSFHDQKQMPHTLQMNNDAVSISGLHGTKAHISDPLTHKISNNKKMICVQADSAFDAEVLSTALFVAPKESNEKILQNFNIKQVIYGN
ncbi:FAD:protein FMN transferase [Saccharicrinis sp. FJH62]|uniref:FAD:protein FMN transferase n=1 Tax=Saccharicrinis sp. FJH62 TaxID=3344657 RepID=UPI0035D41618